jgi:hypothetical protein
MKILDMTQGSDAWLAARLGIPTASNFHRIITAAKGDLSKSAARYAHELVAETLLARPLAKPPGSPWAMIRGKELEPFARASYAQDNKVEVREVGLVTTDCGRLGASPDGLIDAERGAVEIKCLIDENHVGLWVDGPGDDYRQQAQGLLAVAELAWLDLYAWHPNLPAVKIRTYRDEPYIAKMQTALSEFLDMRDAMLAKAKATGWAAHESVGVPATFGAIKLAA